MSRVTSKRTTLTASIELLFNFSCMSQGKEVLDSLPKDKLQRMTQNLIKVNDSILLYMCPSHLNPSWF